MTRRHFSSFVVLALLSIFISLPVFGQTAQYTTNALTDGTLYLKPAAASDLGVTNVGASGAAVTLTIPATTGKFHYITSIQIVKYVTAAITASATPITVTTTNFPGAHAFTFRNVGAIADSEIQQIIPTTPIKSSVVGTATTIVCPATTSVIWRVNVTYFEAAQ